MCGVTGNVDSSAMTVWKSVRMMESFNQTTFLHLDNNSLQDQIVSIDISLYKLNSHIINTEH